MVLGSRIKEARISAKLTQEQLATKIGVSRQAVTKWESDKGLPDVENLKQLAKVLNISIDYLLDDNNKLDMNISYEEIDLKQYKYMPNIRGRWLKKVGKKDMVVRERFPQGEVHMLHAEVCLSRSEKVIDFSVGTISRGLFGIPKLINAIKLLGREYYLVNYPDKQFLVKVTDQYIESRRLVSRITEDVFEMEGYKFKNLGLLKGS